MTAAVEYVLDRLTRVKRNGAGWTARCPAHDDRNPSLSVAEGDDGRALVSCHAGCTIDAILTALELAPSDLFARNGSSAGKTDATYDYVDAQGNLIFQVCRTQPKGFFQRRPDGSGGWINGLGGLQPVLYRLPEVLDAVKVGETVWVAEGEKDVLALERAGVACATCNPMGAQKWRPWYSETLRGAHVVIVRDLDVAGRTHAEQVSGSLVGIAASVTVVDPVSGKDASDHFDGGYGLDDFAAQTVAQTTPAVALRFVPAEQFASIREDSADPLLGDRRCNAIPAGAIAVVYGGGGAGKTTLLIDCGLHLATGTEWLGLDVPRRCRVAWIENEGPRGSFREKLAAKLEAWAGPELDSRFVVLEEPWARFTFADEGLRTELARSIADLNLDVLIVGPVQRLGVEGGGTPAEVGAFVALIEDVRARLGRPLAVILIHHENKSGDVAGAWEGTPDTTLHVTAQGNGKTRLHWEKARWASALHGSVWHLLWREGETFELDQAPEKSDGDIAESIVAVVAANPGASWAEVEEATRGTQAGRRRRIRDSLITDGDLLRLPGKNGGMALYVPGDDSIPPRPEADASEQAENRVAGIQAAADLFEQKPLDLAVSRPRPEADGVETGSAFHPGDEPNRPTPSAVPPKRDGVGDGVVSSSPVPEALVRPPAISVGERRARDDESEPEP